MRKEQVKSLGLRTKIKCFGLALGEGLETGSLHSALCCLCTFRELSSPLVSY